MKRRIILFTLLLFALFVSACSSNTEGKNLIEHGFPAVSSKKQQFMLNGKPVTIACESASTGAQKCELEAGEREQKIDPRIAEAIGERCENVDKLALMLELAYDLPEIEPNKLVAFGDSEHSTYLYNGKEISQEKAEEINQRYLDELSEKTLQARRKALDSFVNSGAWELSQEQKERYVSSEYGELNIIISGCEYQSFLKKVTPYIVTLTLIGEQKGIDYQGCSPLPDTSMLFNTSFTHIRGASEEELRRQKVVIFKQKGDVASHIAELLGENNSTRAQAKAEEVDYTQYDVVAYRSGALPTLGYTLAKPYLCSEDSALKLHLEICSNKPQNEAISWGFALVKVPKGSVSKAEGVEYGLVCEDD